VMTVRDDTHIYILGGILDWNAKEVCPKASAMKELVIPFGSGANRTNFSSIRLRSPGMPAHTIRNALVFKSITTSVNHGTHEQKDHIAETEEQGLGPGLSRLSRV